MKLMFFFSKDHVVTEKDASEKKVVGEKTVWYQTCGHTR